MPGESHGTDRKYATRNATGGRDAWPDGERLCLQIVSALEAFDRFKRHYFPGMPHLRDALAPLQENLASLAAAIDAIATPEPFVNARKIIGEAAGICSEVFRLSSEGRGPDETFLNFRKAGRRINRVRELIYPLSVNIRAVNLYFLEQRLHGRADGHAAAMGRAAGAGIVHARLDDHPYARGGFSFYIPESCDAGMKLPVVVALHGGYGHGRDYLWHWLREARSRGFLLAAPSSRGATWSITGADTDLFLLQEMFEYMQARWGIDERRIFLTGMSDGGTYALKYALHESTPFAAFAVFSCVLPPFDLSHVGGRRILWVHGARDWMFPALYAKNGSSRLTAAKADVALKIIPDLYHAHPQEENDGVLAWFDPSLSV